MHRAGVDLPPTWAAGAHDGIRRELVVAVKDHGVWSLLDPLAEELARAVAAAIMAGHGPPLILVPVPSSPAAVRRRGLDTMAVMAARAASRLTAAGVPVTARRALAQRGPARDQVGLGARDRFANLRRRLQVTSVPTGPVVVVDDIVTTGASLSEATSSLRRAGVDVVACATISARGWA